MILYSECSTQKLVVDDDAYGFFRDISIKAESFHCIAPLIDW